MSEELQQKLPGSQTEYQPASVYITPGASEVDETGLVDLLRVIARRKGTIAIIIIIAISLGLIYVWFAEPVYRAKVYLLPPQQKDVQALQINYAVLKKLGVERYTPDLVYKIFLKNTDSRGLRRKFFDTQNLGGYYSDGQLDSESDMNRLFETKFNEKLNVQVDTQNTSFATASLAHSDPKMPAQWLNQFIEFVSQHTMRQLSSDINIVIRQEIERLRRKLDGKLELARQNKQDKIIQLKEALNIAKVLGIEGTGYLTGSSGENGAEIITVNTAEWPLYQRGIKALEAEIFVLESRKSEEPFIADLRNLQEDIALLEGITVDPDTLSACAVDSPAAIPFGKEKPRGGLIMIVAVILGVMGGIFTAFVAELFSKLSQK